MPPRQRATPGTRQQTSAPPEFLLDLDQAPTALWDANSTELISSFRLKHSEVRVVRDATHDRSALERAMAGGQSQ